MSLTDVTLVTVHLHTITRIIMSYKYNIINIYYLSIDRGVYNVYYIIICYDLPMAMDNPYRLHFLQFQIINILEHSKS